MEGLAEQQAALFAKLHQLGIAHTTKEHKQCFTVEDVESVAEACQMQPQSGRCKNMFLKSKKGELFVFSCQAQAARDMKAISKKLGAPECRFASDEYLTSVLKVVKGSVTPFAAINDAECKATIAIDKDLLAEGTLWFHPLHNDKSTSISGTDLVAFLKAVGHEPKILDFSDVPPAGSAPPPAAKKPAKEGGGAKKEGGGG
eukprot:CAMPEP_0173423392 /NCGR_PEP_ID=MMETSP1357-20121228/3714_1 /TAXON_ID=77926 /ORGANISM="Hemiselmis rufescens, Strain PCC563" /LENGTH=200 /DNA_ID=CAMNT_0014386501 /DNA_START=28 /DNA_END=627 /DNA_ORIENTATION=-